METESQHNKSNKSSSDYNSSFSESSSSSSGSDDVANMFDLDKLLATDEPVVQQPILNDNPAPAMATSEFKSHCEVCYSTVSPDFLQEETKHLFEIVYCKDCHISAHLICQGMSSQLEDDAAPDGRRIKLFHCDMCRARETTKPSACYICNSKEGYLRLTRDDRWVHIPCGMGSPGVSYEDLTDMSINLTEFKKEAQKIRAVKKCELCKVKVETFKCSNEHSFKHSHILCALKSAHTDPQNSKWKASFSIEPQEGLLLHQYQDEQEMQAKFEDIAFALKEIVGDSAIGRKHFEALISLRARKAPKGINVKKKLVREDSQLTNYLNLVLHKGQKKANRVFTEGISQELIDKRENDEYAQHVGGQITLINKLESPKKAQEMEVEEEKQDIARKELIAEFYREIENSDVLLEFYSEQRVSRLRSGLREFPNMPRLSLPEVIFFCMVFQKRAEAAKTNFVSLEDLKMMIESARLLPFSLTKLLKPLNEKYCIGVATDLLLRPLLQNCKPESAYSNSKRYLVKDIVKKNRLVITQAFEVQKLYTRETCGVHTKSYDNAGKYHAQLLFLERFYERIGDYCKTIENEGTGKVVEKIENGFPPRTLLNEMKENAEMVGLKDLSEMKLLDRMIRGEDESAVMEEEEESKAVEPDDIDDDLEDKVKSSDDLFAFKFSKKVSEDDRETRKKKKDKEGKKHRKKTKSAESDDSDKEKKHKKKKNKAAKDDEEDLVTPPKNKNKKKKGSMEEEISLSVQKELAAMIKENNSQTPEKLRKMSTEKNSNKKSEDKGKKGRPTKTEKVLNEIEEEFQRELKATSNPDLREALEQKKFAKIWKAKALEISRKLKKKTENIFEDSDEMVDVNDLEAVIIEVEDHKYADIDETLLYELKQKLANVRKIQEKFHSPGQPMILSHLKEAERKIRSTNIKIPELSILKKKLDNNYKLQRLLEDTVSLKNLEQILRELGNETNGIDGGLYSHLNTKVSEGKRIQEEAKRYLVPGKEYKLGELGNMAYLVKDAEINKVEIPELFEVKAIVDSFILMTRVYGVLCDTLPLDIESLEAGELLSFKGKALFDLILTINTKIKGDGLKTLRESKVDILKDICSKFDIIAAKCDGNSFNDSLFPMIFGSISQGVAKRSTGDMPRAPAPTQEKEETTSNKSSLKMKEQMKAKPFSERVRDWKDGVNDFLQRSPEEALFEIMNSNDDELNYESILDELGVLRKDAEKLIQTYKDDLERLSDAWELGHLIKAVQKIFGWIDWNIDALKAIRRVMDDKEQLEASQVRSLAQKMEDLKLPRNTVLGRAVGDWNKLLETCTKELARIYPGYKIGNSRIAKKDYGRAVDDAGNTRVKDIIDKTRDNKLSEKEIKKLKETLKSANQVVKVTKEIEQVEKDVEKYIKWADAVQELGEHFLKFNDEDLAIREKMNGVKRGMDKLKREFYDIVVLDDTDEMTLKLLEWMLKAGELIKGEEKIADYQVWSNALDDVKDFGDIEGDDGRVNRLREGLKKEVEKTANLRNLIKSLKEGQKLNLVDLKRWLDCGVKCRVKVDEEQRALEKMHRECREVKEKVERFLGSCKDGRKSHISEFKDFLQKVKNLPVKLVDEEEKIVQAIRQGENIQEQAIRSESYDLRELTEQYRNCPVYVQEMEDMQGLLDSSKIAGKFVKSKLKDLTSMDGNMSFQELLDIEKKCTGFQKVFQMKGRGEGVDSAEKDMKALKKEIFVKKCEALKNRISERPGRDDGTGFTVKHAALKEMLAEGEKLTRGSRDDYKLVKSVVTLKDLIKKVDETLEKVGRARNTEDLERLPRKVLGVLDISDELAEKKDELRSRKSREDVNIYKENSKGKDIYNTLLDKNEILKLKFGQKLKEQMQEKMQEKEKKWDWDFEEKREKERDREIERKKDPFASKNPAKTKQADLLAMFKKEEKTSSRWDSPGRSKGFEDEWKRSPERGKSKLSEKPRKSSIEEIKERKPSPKAKKPMEVEKPRKSKEPVKIVKDKHSIIAELKSILESTEYAELSLLEYFDFAKAIFACFPEMQEKEDKYNKVTGHLKALLRCEYITKSLIERKFEKGYTRCLIDLDEQGVKVMEEELRGKFGPVTETKYEIKEDDRDWNRNQDSNGFYQEPSINNDLATLGGDSSRGFADHNASNNELATLGGDSSRGNLDNESMVLEDSRGFNQENTNTDSLAAVTKESDKYNEAELDVKTPFRAAKEGTATEAIAFSTASTFGHQDMQTSNKKISMDKDRKSPIRTKADEYDPEQSTSVHKEGSPVAKRLAFEKTNASIDKTEAMRSVTTVAENISPKKLEAQVSRQSPLTKKPVSPKPFQMAGENIMEPEGMNGKEKTLEDSNVFLVYEKVTHQVEAPKEEINLFKPKNIEVPVEKINEIPLTGTILKIFEGTLRYDEHNKEYQKVGFYTCDPYKTVASLPKISEKGQDEVKIEGKLSQSRFEAYLSQMFNQWDKKAERMISGWIESAISVYQSRFDQIARELQETQKVSMAGYHESAKIFFFHKDQLPESWKLKIGFNIKKIKKGSDPSLCFVIIHKPYKMKQGTKSIEPEVIVPAAEKASSVHEGEIYSIKSSVNKNAEMDFGAEYTQEVQQPEIIEIIEQQPEATGPTYREPVYLEPIYIEPTYLQPTYVEVKSLQNQIVEKVASVSIPYEMDPRKRRANLTSTEKILEQKVSTEKMTEEKDPSLEAKRPLEAVYANDEIEGMDLEKKVKLDDSKTNPIIIDKPTEAQQEPVEVNEQRQESVMTELVQPQPQVQPVEEIQPIEQVQTMVEDKPAEYDGSAEYDPFAERERDPFADGDELLGRLRKMDHEELLAYAKGLDIAQRESIIRALQEVSSRSRSVSPKPYSPLPMSSLPKTFGGPITVENLPTVHTLTSMEMKVETITVNSANKSQPYQVESVGHQNTSMYNPPDYIRRFYDLFTYEQMEDAAKKVKSQKGSNMMTTAETTPYNGRFDDKKFAYMMTEMAVETELKTIQHENEAKFQSLRAFSGNSENSGKKVMPQVVHQLAQETSEFVSHNPIEKMNCEEENTEKQGDLEDASANEGNENAAAMVEEEAVVDGDGITLGDIKIVGENITIPKELYEQLMNLGSVTQGENNAEEQDLVNIEGIEGIQDLLENLQKLGGGVDLGEMLNALIAGNGLNIAGEQEEVNEVNNEANNEVNEEPEQQAEQKEQQEEAHVDAEVVQEQGDEGKKSVESDGKSGDISVNKEVTEICSQEIQENHPVIDLKNVEDLKEKLNFYANNLLNLANQGKAKLTGK